MQNGISSATTPYLPPPSPALPRLPNGPPASDDTADSDTLDVADALAVDGQTPEKNELKEAFQDFVGQTFFSEMIKAFRSTQQPAAYFDGGRAEEIFQGQFDQVLSEELSESSADKIADPMFELFMLGRPS